MSNKSKRLTAAAMTYFALLLVFAGLYHRMYQHDGYCFLVNEAIVHTRQDELLQRYLGREADIRSDLPRLQRVRESIDAAADEVRFTIESIRLEGFDIGGPRIYLHTWSHSNEYCTIRLDDTSGSGVAVMSISTHNDGEIHAKAMCGISPGDLEQTQLLRIIDNILVRNQVELRQIDEALSNTRPLDPGWTYADFVYFSVVTQTTLGFGDILPNSTPVRKLVSAQALLGVLIAAFALSFIAARD